MSSKAATQDDDKGVFEELIKPITKRAFKNMKPSSLKNTFSNKTERKLYIVSFFVNPIALYFLTHNKYFFLRLDLKLYGLVALIGYFFEKGTCQFFKEKYRKDNPKRRMTNMSTNKYEKKLSGALDALNVVHQIAKVHSNEFATQIYVLSDQNDPEQRKRNSEKNES